MPDSDTVWKKYHINIVWLYNSARQIMSVETDLFHCLCDILFMVVNSPHLNITKKMVRMICGSVQSVWMGIDEHFTVPYHRLCL